MPELPEAETIARGLRVALSGRTIDEAVLVRADVFHGNDAQLRESVDGGRVATVDRWGKRVVIHMDNDTRIVFALGMTGRLTIATRQAPCQTHTHFRLSFDRKRREVRFRDPRRFGGVWLLTHEPNDSGKRLGDIGRDPFEIRPREFRELLRRRRRIKDILLDQSLIAGLGNIYCDESLHRAGIHPASRASELSGKDVARLLQQIRLVLRAAIRSRGSTLNDHRDSDGQPGSFQRKHRVYGRRGHACKACGAMIVRVVLGGRSTHYCPLSQPGPVSRDWPFEASRGIA